MQWYIYILIAVGGLFGLIFTMFILSKLTRPSFKKFKSIQKEQSKVSPKKNVEAKEGVGLNLEQAFGAEELEYAMDNKSPKRERRAVSPEELEEFKKRMNLNPNPQAQTKEKSIAEQIQELSPELKAILFNGGLARKEYDFKSKKD